MLRPMVIRTGRHGQAAFHGCSPHLVTVGVRVATMEGFHGRDVQVIEQVKDVSYGHAVVHRVGQRTETSGGVNAGAGFLNGGQRALHVGRSPVANPIVEGLLEGLHDAHVEEFCSKVWTTDGTVRSCQNVGFVHVDTERRKPFDHP
jgi:hypothetical protein